MKQMRGGLSLVWVGILILALVFTAYPACQPTPDTDEIVLYETTKVFTEEEAENVLEFTEDRDTIVFEEVTAFVADIEPGDVLVSEHPVPGGEYGFLERVIEVSDDGKAVEVEPATLEDAIEQGVIVVTQTIPKEDLMADAMWAPGVQVLQIQTGYSFSYSPAAGVTIKGHLTVTADAQVDLEASFWRGLQKFEFVFSPGFEMEGSLEATAGLDWEKDWTLGKAKAVIPIWGPVAFNLAIELVVGTDGKIETKLETSVTYQRGYDVGFRYDKSAGWSTIKNVKGAGADVKEPTLQGKVEGRVYGGIRLSASVGVSYVLEAGLELELLGNVKGSGIVKTPPWEWEYDFELYLTAQLAVGLDALLIGDVKYKFDPWRWPDPPEYNLAYGASGQVRTDSGEALGGVTITFSDGRPNVTTEADGYWCKHLSRGAVTATPYLEGYTFDPPDRTMTGSESNYDFVASKLVNLYTSSTDGGSVTTPAEPGPHPYCEGDTVSLEATPDDKSYKFVGWTANPPVAFSTPGIPQTTFTMPAQDVTVTANFEPKPKYKLAISSTTGGSVTVIPPKEAGDYTYYEGTRVELVAKAEDKDGYKFDNWTGDVDTIPGQVDNPDITIEMQDNYSFTANFKKLKTWCGDGKIQKPNEDKLYEECDPGNDTFPPAQPPCPDGTVCSKCKCVTFTANPFAPWCGDGTVSPGEECDPGNPAKGIPPVPCLEGEEEICIKCQCEPAGYVTPEEPLKVGASAGCSCDFAVYGDYYPGYYSCDCGYTSYTSQYECGCSFPTYFPQYVLCHSCIVTINLWVQDLSGGSCPITGVSLELGEDVPGIGRAWVWGSGPISEEFFQYTYVMEVLDWCEETVEFLVSARNSCGTVAEFIGYIVCPPQSS